MGDKEIVFWNCDKDAELLSCEYFDEAIEDYLVKIPFHSYPKKLAVYGFARMTIDENDCEDVLEDLINRLDEDYGSPDGPSNITADMIQAETEFIRVVVQEYIPWTCELVKIENVNISKWLENNKEWSEKQRSISYSTFDAEGNKVQTIQVFKEEK